MREPDDMLMQQEWSPEFLSTSVLDAVQTEYEVLRLMRQCTSHFNFTHFLVARLPTNDQQRFSERLMVSNWPVELVRKYDALGTFHASKLFAEVTMTKRPVIGDGQLLAPRDPSDSRRQEVLELAEEHGFGGCVAFLLHSTGGEPHVMLYAGQREVAERAEMAFLYYASVQLFECQERTSIAGLATREKLSSREIECLRWAAAGKSSDEIAIILGISVYTVSSYFKSATKKLQAVNRMQAIASAMRMKLI
ncbi:LuxR C-terminal-related transcriptional regulator [Sinorhizobium sp. BG8]|uniref:helix-turn-helix transcriptional regulator n=1 Tax=Sinorhizobium sp. BG8 TaxID=2613773 RepID=UPI00193CFDCC|nr:LuxR C-terminal-related transcriptional regulator [Sinorhizobium sp. BG8]QRM56560.1 LuxR family transcriptional regulator [Sinorhizobium sp. BG8]